MVALTGAPAVADAQRRVAAQIALSPAALASTTRYMASADRARAVSDVGWKLGVGLAVLIVVTWALGGLPGTARLF